MIRNLLSSSNKLFLTTKDLKIKSLYHDKQKSIPVLTSVETNF